jgi:hypothetical protein
VGSPKGSRLSPKNRVEIENLIFEFHNYFREKDSEPKESTLSESEESTELRKESQK